MSSAPVKNTADASTSINLGNLAPADGAARLRRRKGRGRASGHGKTCNRGHNGEGQRSGCSRKRGFEGGQMPLYRRIPKLDGFRVINQRVWLEINVGEIEAVFPDKTELTYDDFRDAGLLTRKMDGIRILGNGEFTKAYTVQAHHATKSATEKFEKAGGSLNLIAMPEPHDGKKAKAKRARERVKAERA